MARIRTSPKRKLRVLEIKDPENINIDDLNEHKLMEHGVLPDEDELHKCFYCDKSFMRESELEQHQNNTHFRLGNLLSSEHLKNTLRHIHNNSLNSAVADWYKNNPDKIV